MRARSVLVAIAASITLLTACSGNEPPTVTPPSSGPTSPTASSPNPSPSVQPARGGPAIPESGALLGAWTRPTVFTQAGRVAAFLEFEKLIGRELDLVHVFNEWADPFPTPSDRELAAQRPVLMISWSGTDTRAIASGLEDDVIRQQAQGIKSLGKPILLRWRWEMDRPNLQASVWSPEDYIAAWKHIRKIFDAEQVTNVGWVWCPHARGYVEPGRNAAAYYPGDDSVDWLCADVYAEPDDSSFQEAAGPFLEWAAKHPKPIVIGEFGSRRGDRGAWLREAAEAIQRNPQIKAIAYFDGNSKAAAGGEYRLAPSPDAVEAFRELAKRPHFASAGG